MPFVTDPPVLAGDGALPLRPVDLQGYRPSKFHHLSARCSGRFSRVINRLPGRKLLNRFGQRGTEFCEIEVTVRRASLSLDGFCIAYLSDVHVGSFMDEDDLCRLFARIADYQPDLICLGGDLINTHAEELESFARPLAMVRPRHGYVAVPGNHEHFWGRGMDHWHATMRELGVSCLLNEGRRLSHRDAGFWLCGVDDLCEGNPDIELALQGHDADEPVILLSHNPDYYLAAAAKGVDLTISGHTHGGQILLFGWTPLRHTKHGFWRGLHANRETSLYISRGVGVSILPLRIGARPEVSILKIRSRESG